ncbi:MAG TPA: hypothetical protein VFT62_03390 [Mycobacteriales bacterium]|nr:hypothetical protein [Mycobacteriales bacterium]
MFIQMVQGACTREDEMRGLVDDWCGRMADQPGWLGGTYGFTDDGCFVGVVRYADRDACAMWCKDAEAAPYWAAATQLFDESCEIFEADDVSIMLDGGSDDAGFVQVMHGRVNDTERMRRLLTDAEMTTMLHEARPEIIGATLAFQADGTFTETVAFTDEASARRGEELDMPEEVSKELMAAMGAVEYLDLHRPWFHHHR